MHIFHDFDYVNFIKSAIMLPSFMHGAMLKCLAARLDAHQCTGLTIGFLFVGTRGGNCASVSSPSSK